MRWQWLVLIGVGIAVSVVSWRLSTTTRNLAPSQVPVLSPSPQASNLVESGPADGPGSVIAHEDGTSPDTPPIAREPAGLGHMVRGVLWQGGAALANAPMRVFAGPEVKLVQVAATTTEADGGFSLPMPKEPYLFVVDGPSIPRGWWSRWQEPHASDWDLGVVHVPKVGALVGLVRDDAGAGIADALVQVEYRDGGRIPIFAAGSKPEPVRSDARGTFRIDGLQPGTHHVTAAVANHALAETEVVVVENGTASAELRVNRGGRLEGIVRDWLGRPLPGASVQMESASEVFTTDASGRFQIDHYFFLESLRVAAGGHIEAWHRAAYPARFVEIQLDRAVTLRGSVRGADGSEVTLRITAAKDPASDAAPARPWDLLDKALPVDADGTFVIEGLSTSDFVVRANTSSGGSSAPLRVALREDATIELAIRSSLGLRVQVQDPEGRPIEGAEVVQDLGVAEFPSLYFGPEEPKVQARIMGSGSHRILGNYRKQVFAMQGGTVVLPVVRDQPLAFGVRHPSFLPAIRLFAAGEAPPDVVVVLARAGSVRGIVRGGAPAEYGRSVELWRLADEAKRAKKESSKTYLSLDDWPLTTPIDAEGRFVATGLEPGAWRAAVTRFGRARTSRRPDEQVGAVPLVDDGADERAIVDFTVDGGDEATIELVEPKLGTLRGQVVFRGAPCSGVHVMAARPGALEGWRPRGWDEDGTPDWDDQSVRGWAAGQTTAADGAFTFRYAAAGPVELRLRHSQGAATSPPTILVLPEPGFDVVHTLELPGGSLRGRFALESLPAKERRFVEAVLYPLSKASADPSYHTDYSTPVAWRCARVELDEQGEFAFDYLPDGDWLLRVQGHALDREFWPHWQRVVAVNGSVVDLGDLAAETRVTAKVACTWSPDAVPGTRIGVWLYVAHGGESRAVWAGTFLGSVEGLACSVPAGKYVVVPFAPYAWFHGHHGLSGTPLASPVAIDVRADGSVSPPTIRFDAFPPSGDGR